MEKKRKLKEETIVTDMDNRLGVTITAKGVKKIEDKALRDNG